MDEESADFLSLDDNDNALLQKVTFLNHPDCCYRCKRTNHALVDYNFAPHFPHDSKSRYSPLRIRHSPSGSPPPVISDVPLEEPTPVVVLDPLLPACSPMASGGIGDGLYPVTQQHLDLGESYVNPDMPGITLDQASGSHLPDHLRVRTATPSRVACGAEPVAPKTVLRVAWGVLPGAEGEIHPDAFYSDAPLPSADAVADRWADYSSASDSEIRRHRSAFEVHHLKHPNSATGDRLVRSPPLHCPTQLRQQEHSPSRHRHGTKRFNPKVAARHGASSSREVPALTPFTTSLSPG
ncbi:unnamed protein product [Calypogeia fissa]